VWVGREDSHSLLVVPADWVFPAATGMAEVSFGDRRWMTCEDRSLAHVSRMAVWPTEGGFYLKRVPLRRSWDLRAVPLSPLGAQALRAELERWWRRDEVVAAWSDGTLFTASRQDFHLFRSCNHQVAAYLEAAGVPLPARWTPWLTAGRLEQDVETALADLRAAGIRFVEPFESE
jgi:hypothetical protein